MRASLVAVVGAAVLGAVGSPDLGFAQNLLVVNIETALTTSTLYSTSTSTIWECPGGVCTTTVPAAVVTSVVAFSTTICPITYTSSSLILTTLPGVSVDRSSTLTTTLTRSHTLELSALSPSEMPSGPVAAVVPLIGTVSADMPLVPNTAAFAAVGTSSSSPEASATYTLPETSSGGTAVIELPLSVTGPATLTLSEEYITTSSNGDSTSTLTSTRRVTRTVQYSSSTDNNQAINGEAGGYLGTEQASQIAELFGYGVNNGSMPYGTEVVGSGAVDAEQATGTSGISQHVVSYQGGAGGVRVAPLALLVCLLLAIV